MKIFFVFFIFYFSSFSSASVAVLTAEQQTASMFKNYSENVELIYTELLNALKAEAPDLQEKFAVEKPKEVPHGYQILPTVDWKIESLKAGPRVAATSNTYSWPKTQQFMKWEKPKIEDFESRIKILPKLEKKDRRPVLEKLISDFKELNSTRVLIDNHIKHNSFWQPIILKDKPRFDRLTKLHDSVLLREDLLKYEALDSDSDNSSKKIDLFQKIRNYSIASHIKEDQISDFEKKLSKIIFEQNSETTPPTFLHQVAKSEYTTAIEVPLYTDIENKEFLKNFKLAIEKIWHVEAREKTFEISLKIKPFHPKKVPARGKDFKIDDHVAQFPKDGGVLTTGASATYAITGRFIALGPHAVTANVLAHEFGHILGFIDTYFRGYKDLSSDGLEIEEIVPDPMDIMCSPGTGRVFLRHFEILFSKMKPTKI